MRRDYAIYLISYPDEPNDINAMGDPIKTPIKREVFAEKNSIRQSEFYQAAANGLKPEINFTIYPDEYNGESALEFEEQSYSIIRTFKKNDKEFEVICEGLAKG